MPEFEPKFTAFCLFCWPKEDRSQAFLAYDEEPERVDGVWQRLFEARKLLGDANAGNPKAIANDAAMVLGELLYKRAYDIIANPMAAIMAQVYGQNCLVIEYVRDAILEDGSSGRRIEIFGCGNAREPAEAFERFNRHPMVMAMIHAASHRSSPSD